MGLTKSIPYVALSLSSSSKHGEIDNHNNILVQEWKGQPLNTPLTKNKYCSLIRNTRGLPSVFRNPYYAFSFFYLFSPDKAQLRIEHVQKGVSVLSSGTMAEKAELVFDWLDRNHKGYVTSTDLQEGLMATGRILTDALSYWLWLYTPRDYEIDEAFAYDCIVVLQRLVPPESFQRFVEVVISNTGRVTRDEWLDPGNNQARREAIELFTAARCGDILKTLSSPQAILQFSNVTPTPLTPKEVQILDQRLLEQQHESLFVDRLLELRTLS